MRMVVIGGNAAGMSAAARARRVDPSLDITVLEKSAHVSWGACGLPYYLEGQVRSLDTLVVRTEGDLGARNIDVQTRTEAVSIEHARRRVVVSGGTAVPYDRLVIASGARPDSGGVNGRVLTLSTMDDAARLRAILERDRPRRAAVVGGGWLGLELAGTLRAWGCSVEIWEARADLAGYGDPDLTAALSNHLAACGVGVRPSSRITDASQTNSDIVVLAAGFTPNVALAVEAGVQIGRTGAIRTSDHLETNLTGVYAAGDCVEITHLVTGRAAWLPLGSTANKMGRIAGANACGRRERFPGVAGTFIARVCGMGLAVTGLSAAHARREGFDAATESISARERAEYFFGAKCTVGLTGERGSGRILGGWITGEDGVAGRINVIAAAVSARMRVDDFEQLDLAYTPPYGAVWDPLLIAARQLRRVL